METTAAPTRHVDRDSQAAWSDDPATDLPSLQLAQSSRFARRIAKMLLIVLALSAVALLFVPWQQSVTGSGRVIAYAPLKRQQTVEAPVYGRIADWNERVVEGVRVSQGERILEIRDVDPDFVIRLEAQVLATERKLEAAETKVQAYQSQVQAFTEAREKTIEGARQLIEIARQKIRAEEEQLAAARAAELQERLDFDRQKTLLGEGLTSEAKYQLAERKYREAEAKVTQAQAYLASARNELMAKEAELEQKSREAQAKIDSARAYLQDAEGEVQVTSKDLADSRIKLARQQSQIVRAPQDGYILRLHVNPGAEMIKAGDPLFTIVPDTADRAVEIYVSGNDASLIEPGRHVRMQFEGWPAVQFAGWPSVAVGTFGGQVALVDATDNGQGQFRVLVVPDPTDQPWPDQRYLRQGVRSNGWVLLNQVPLGYELWRKLNGFPPALPSGDKEEKTQGFTKSKK